MNSKHALSGGDEGTGNAVVIGLNPVIQGFCLSPEGLRYIFVLFKFSFNNNNNNNNNNK